MRGGWKDRGGLERGQATVEFALVLPLLVVCIAGIVWVGNIVSLQVRLEHAAREGARAAAVEPLEAASASRAAVEISMGSAPQVSTSVDAEYVVVDVQLTTGGVPIIGVGERTLRAVAHMRREDIND